MRQDRFWVKIPEKRKGDRVKNKYVAFAGILLMLFNGCEFLEKQGFDQREEIPLPEMDIPNEFNFSTKQEVTVTIRTVTPSGQVLGKTRINVFTQDKDGMLNQLFSGTSSESGVFQNTYTVPKSLESVVLETDRIGLVSQLVIPIVNGEINCDFSDLHDTTLLGKKPASGLTKTSSAYPIVFLGEYNTLGVPQYLAEPGDLVDTDFLSDIDASLPEMSPVSQFHPEYLAQNNQINTLLGEPADIWVTFVHEGAGFTNILGFYTYESNDPPQTIEEIDSVTIIFPNISYRWGGGGLNSGDKVCLGHFPAGTEIAWVLFANGWKDDVTLGHLQVYSNPEFNPEGLPELQQHNVLLYDEARDLTLLGFEDLDRRWGSDDDFNDALFYVTSNPRIAIVTDGVMPITYTGNDTDGDGVNDPIDDYPNDPDRAYNNYHPSKNTFGSLSFEDLWPYQGDYDFNDLVVDYRFTEIMNAQNEIVDMDVELVLKASGASYENGLGFEMDLEPGMVSNVSGSVITGDLVTLMSNGLEADQEKAVFIAFDNVYGLANRPEGYYINTQERAPFVAQDTILIQINFTQPLAPDILGAPPYNPFMIINQDRTREVHLAGYSPTTLARNSDYFDTGEDHSSVNGYYRTSNCLPWALDIVETLDYPIEKAAINNAHLYFESWAVSGGQIWNDWYKDKPGYRDGNFIYSP